MWLSTWIRGLVCYDPEVNQCHSPTSADVHVYGQTFSLPVQVWFHPKSNKAKSVGKVCRWVVVIQRFLRYLLYLATSEQVSTSIVSALSCECRGKRPWEWRRVSWDQYTWTVLDWISTSCQERDQLWWFNRMILNSRLDNIQSISGSVANWQARPTNGWKPSNHWRV